MPNDGLAWIADENCGVFVSAGRGSAEGSGTKDAPLNSLQEAVARARQMTGRVYACAGEGEGFDEAVDVPSGVTVYGGFDCGNDWLWIGDTTKTTLTAAPGTIPLTMQGIPGVVHIEDVHVFAQPGSQETKETVSSIAAIALSTNVELVRCMLEARDAALGANGAPPLYPPAVAPAGLAGGDACSREDGGDVAGGRTVRNDCDTTGDLSDDSVGGKGGDGRMSEGYDGASGEPRVSADDERNGGHGHEAGETALCDPGDPGKSRDAGMPGADATGRGAISAAGYAGVAGMTGGRGMPGQGGGGGGGERGASEGSRNCGGFRSRAGAGGGSGGAGGCGGAGGRGGLPGGASIALVSIDAVLSFNEVILKSAKGGNGGNGGEGQQGGEGGAGGPGGTVPMNSEGIFAGCAGGSGGRGGNGGKGGGGQGGHSLGIAFLGQEPPTEGVEIYHGTVGRGGTGASPDRRGADGVAMDVLGFN
ncbi:hypothetical protein [Sorangium cellulosum]|uniref:hypothetical protein n=1 Tax=Sorangium cellulosum TaxID=56 RepID=UPI0022793D06|nr:hypothetical protein [Sorangium cellulosum]